MLVCTAAAFLTHAASLEGGSEMVWVQLDCPSFPGDVPHPPAKSGVYALQVRTGSHVPAQPRVILRRQKAFVMGRIHVGRAKSHQLLVAGVPFTKTKRGLTPAGCLLCARHLSWVCDMTGSPLLSSAGHGGAHSGGKGTPGQQLQAVAGVQVLRSSDGPHSLRASPGSLSSDSVCQLSTQLRCQPHGECWAE